MSLRPAIAALAVLGAASLAYGQDALPGRVVVRYRDDVVPTAGRSVASPTGHPSLDALQAAVGVRKVRALFGGGTSTAAQARDRFPRRAERASRSAAAVDLGRIYVLEIPQTADVKEVAARLAADPGVVYAHPDYLFHLDFVPDDPYFSSSGTWGQAYDDLWGLHITDAETAWDISTGAGVTVAVVDTGFDATHPDLAANLWTNPGEIAGNGIDDDGNGFIDDVHGWDFDAGDNDTTDGNGHGTHVSGTIAAVGDNGLGVIGMAWGSRIMPVQGFGPSGSAPSSTLAEAIVYAAENGADVINASFGGPFKSQVMEDAVNTALSLGTVFVAAAGNDGADVNNYEPAGIPGVIAVSASNRLDQPASFSNHGDAISVSAPGVDILSLRAAGTNLGPLVGTDYTRLQGTSMAAPHVTGLVAVLLGAQPALDIDEVRWHLELNADQPGWPGYEGEAWNPYFGYGRIDAGRVFDPPLVTSRLKPRRLERHAYSGSVIPLTDLSLSFTTHDPIDWSLTPASPFSADPSSGTGSSTVTVALDATSLSPGQTLIDTLAAEGAAIQSSESFRATVHTHRDDRVGAEIEIEADPASTLPFFSGDWSLRSATTGSAAMVVWYSASDGVQAACMDSNATVIGRVPIAGGATRWNFDVATDGANFAVVWVDDPDTVIEVRRTRRVLVRRFAPDCTALDAAPIAVDEREYRPYLLAYFPGIGFDGTAYTVVWQTRYVLLRGNDGTYNTRFYLRRVGSDGALSVKRRRISTRQSQRAHVIQDTGFDCRSGGGCLLTWRWYYTQYAMPINGERADHRRRTVVLPGFNDVMNVDDLVAGPDDYLLVGRRASICDTSAALVLGPLECKEDVKAQRISPTAAPLTPQTVVVNQGTGDFMPRRGRVRATADGTSYLVSFNRPWRLSAGGPGGGEVFLGRVLANGSIGDLEHEGLLVAPIGSSANSTVTMLGGDALLFWADSRNATTHVTGNPAANSVYAQRFAP